MDKQIRCAFSYSLTSSGNAQVFFNIRPQIKSIVSKRFLNSEKRSFTEKVVSYLDRELMYLERQPTDESVVARPNQEEVEIAAVRWGI